MTFMQKQVVISEPVRTPISAFGGVFKNTPAVELGGAAIKEVLKRTNLKPEQIDATIMGNVIQAGNKPNPAQQAAYHGGINSVVFKPSMTVNRVCGSGMQAVISAVQEIFSGTGEAFIAGGMENMDMAPYLMANGRYGSRFGDTQMVDAIGHDGLNDPFTNKPAGFVTEKLVTKYNVSREQQDQWAFRSQHNFAAAQAAGKFDAEIVGIEVADKKGKVVINKDTSNRPETTLEALSKLKPAFVPQGGTITAGNAPSINAGAAAMLVSTEEFARENNLKPMVRIVGFAIAAVDPEYFGIGPVPAVRQLIERTGWQLKDVERFEFNEAFAAIPIAIANELGLDHELVNVEGGAVAHGHPIGATGAILITRLAHSMKRDGLRKGIAALCIGGGQGIALALETIN